MGPQQNKQGQSHRDKGTAAGAGPRGKHGPPPPECPPRCPLTVQKLALIAAVLYDWLIIESVIISRSKNVQVILGGDFGRLKFSPFLFNEEALAEDIGLFEALEDSGLFPEGGVDPSTAAEEAFAVTQSNEELDDALDDTRMQVKRSKRRKLSKTLPKRNQSRKGRSST